MIRRLCRSAFASPFNGLFVLCRIKTSDKVPNNLHFLSAVAAGLVRCVDDDLLHKRIDDGGRQLLNAYVLADNGAEIANVGFVLFIGIDRRLLLFNKLRQFFPLQISFAAQTVSVFPPGYSA